jgi:hypothetical protein
VKGDGDGRRARIGVACNINAFPAEILGRRGEDKIRRFRVVDRSIGKNEGRGDAGQGFTLTMGGQGLEKAFVIGLAAIGVIGMQALGDGLGKTFSQRAVVAHPDMRGFQAGQDFGQPALDRLLHVAAGGVEKYRLVTLEQGIDLLGLQTLGKAGFHGEPVFRTNFGHGLELALRHGRGGDKKQGVRMYLSQARLGKEQAGGDQELA